MLVRYNIIRKKTGTYGSLYEPPLEMPTCWVIDPVGVSTLSTFGALRWA